MKKHIKDVLIALLVIFLFLFYSDILLLPLYAIGIDVNEWSELAKIIFLLLYESSLVLILFLIYKKDMLTDWKDFKKNWKKYFEEYIKYWLILLVLMYASNALIMIIQKLLNHSQEIANNEEEVRKLINNFPIYMIISAIVLGPLEEEIVFRKTCRKIFRNKWVFIILSGLFFGLMHVVTSLKEPLDLLFIISYSIPGWIFAYVYDKSKNIFVNTMLHTIHNGVLVILQILLMII
jgi:hypothetical protein